MISKTEAVKILEKAGCAPNVIEHCLTVSSLAVEIAKKLKDSGKEVDLELVEAGAILHDLGRSKTHGISHAVEGFLIAKQLGLDPKLAEIIKRHIGGGIASEEAKAIGIPADDYFPHTLEEKIVAHADNLVKGNRRISVEERLALIREKKLGEVVARRIKTLAFEIEGEP